MKTLKAALFTILFYFLFPFIMLILILPNFLLRSFVKILRHVLRKDLGNMISPLSNMFGVDKLYEAPTATLILGSTYEGLFTEELVCKMITERWLDKIDPLGKVLYPELRQGLTNWLGFTFWKNDNQFSVLNHVRTLEKGEDHFTGGNMRNLFVSLVNSPFVEKRSPWEVVLVHDYKSGSECRGTSISSQTLILFKVHHSLIDGFSMLNLGETVLGNFPHSKDRFSDNSDFEYSFLSKFMAIVGIPYFIARTLARPSFGPLSSEMIRETRQVSYFNMSKIPLQTLKELKVKYGVTLSSLFLAGFTAGIRQLLATNKGFHGLSEGTSCIIPVPLPGHPEKLTNHMSFVTVDLPLSENCPRKRLLALNESLNCARSSLDTLSLYYMMACMGRFPSLLVKLIVRSNPMPFLLTNFPGPSLPLSVEEHRCRELFFSGGLLDGHLHAICSCIGYEEYVYVALSMGERFGEMHVDMEEFLDFIIRELDSLKNHDFEGH